MFSEIYRNSQICFKQELKIPLVVASISFGFWISSEIPVAQFILCAFIGMLVLKRPMIGILFLLANESLIGSTPPLIAGISLTQIISGFCIIALLAHKRIFPPLLNLGSLLAISIFVTFSISYWNYFQQIDLSIFNNLAFFILVLWGFNFKDPSAICQAGLTLIFTNLLLVGISMVYFIGNPEEFKGGPFGNPRQVGFFGLLALPYLYIISNYVKSLKRSHYLMLLGLSFITIFNFITGSRLNIFILFIIFCFLNSRVFKFTFLPRKLVYAGMLLAVFLLFSQGFVDKYLSRGLVKLGSITDVQNLDESDMGAFSSGRSVIYEYGMEMYRDYPLFGGGYKRWSHISNIYNPLISEDGTERWSMHSTHLQYLAETGIFGLALYWIFLGIVGYRSWKAIIKARDNPNSPMFMCGCIGFFVSLAMFLGGTFDNHSIIYRQLFFAAAAAVSLSSAQFVKSNTT